MSVAKSSAARCPHIHEESFIMKGLILAISLFQIEAKRAPRERQQVRLERRAMVERAAKRRQTM